MRKTCKRKHYALMNPITLAVSGATISSEADLDQLRMRELAALQAFATGAATPQDFRDLCDMVNVTETFAGMGVGPEALAAVEAAQAALLCAKDQYEATGAMRFEGEFLQALRDVYEFHDLQRTSVDRSQYERAIAKTRNRIRSSHPSVKVLA